jgi:uncharacterized repeat protein (TIGR01451 family)
MKNIKLFSLTFLTIIALLSTAQTAEAGNGSYGQYGQYGTVTPSQGITVDKLVGRGSTTKGGQISFVDNYSPNDTRFRPGEKVYFQIKVKNTSNVTLTNVVVKDYIPTYMEPMEGPGTYDANTRTVTYTIASLKPGQEHVANLLMQVYPQNKLAADKGLMCLTNKAQATVNGMTDDDTAQFCVEKEVVGVQNVPSTGPELGLLFLGGNIATLAGGMFLKKKAQK